MSRPQAVSDLGIIIAAAGSGYRFASKKSKLFADFKNMPVFIHSVKVFIDLCPPENFILVVKDSDKDNFVRQLAEFLPGRQVNLVIGGETRMQSVFNGLQALPEAAKFAAIHDAARPFATPELLFGCLDQARVHQGAVVAKKVTDTVKKACKEKFIKATIDRSELWMVETPQIFPRATLIKAYQKAFADDLAATDDSGVMEHAGFSPFLYEHKSDNSKITFAEDLNN